MGLGARGKEKMAAAAAASEGGSYERTNAAPDGGRVTVEKTIKIYDTSISIHTPSILGAVGIRPRSFQALFSSYQIKKIRFFVTSNLMAYI